MLNLISGGQPREMAFGSAFGSTTHSSNLIAEEVVVGFGFASSAAAGGEVVAAVVPSAAGGGSLGSLSWLAVLLSEL